MLPLYGLIACADMDSAIGLRGMKKETWTGSQISTRSCREPSIDAELAIPHCHPVQGFALIVIDSDGVPREQKMLKGHPPRVI